MPNFTIQREESENDSRNLASWAVVPSPRYPPADNLQALVPVSQSWAAKRYSPRLPEDVADNENPNPYIHLPNSGPFDFPNNQTNITFYISAQTINFGGPTQPQHDENRPLLPVEKDADSDTDMFRRSKSPISPSRDKDVDSDTDMSRRSKSPRSPGRVRDDDTAFFNWGEFREDVIPRRKTPMRASHEDVIDAFSGVEVSGPVKGIGRFAKPLINRYHSSVYVSEFQASGERVILRPRPSEQDAPSTPTTTRREFERLECELFDVSKYLGNTNHLTVLTWASDSHWGTITLFEVDVSEANDGASDWDRKGHRQKNRVLQEGVKVRPVAAMEDVPKGILVNMRIDQDIRKTVLEHSNGRFRWRAQVRPGPSYARVSRSRSLSPLQHNRQRSDSRRRSEFSTSNAVHSDSEDQEVGENGERSYAVRGRRRYRRAAEAEMECDDSGETGDAKVGKSLSAKRRRPRPRSLLRAEDAIINSSNRTLRHKTRNSPTRGRTSGGGRAEKDPGTGIAATIPQFMALLHANRSILEIVSAHEGPDLAEVHNDLGGRRRDATMRSVTIAEKPVGRRHAGRDVHVVVLMPNVAHWAEETIFWTDEQGELSDLRQKVFWDVIERGRSCSSRPSRPKSSRKRVSSSIDSGSRSRRTGGRRKRDLEDRSRSPPQSARW